MGLAAAQVHFLMLTQRKADCELDISLANNQKLSLAREMTQLSQEYSSRLNAKELAYYSKGQYRSINYSYLMGYGNNSDAIIKGSAPLKQENSMILTDYKGQAVLSSDYARAIESATGVSADAYGRGGTFSTDKIPEILASLFMEYSADQFREVINGGDVTKTINSETKNTMTGETTGSSTMEVSFTSAIQKIIDFYVPIFSAAATNGWTTEYNEQIKNNEDYISDAIISGSLQLATVGPNGQYEEDTSLRFYTQAGYIETITDGEANEELAAWYNAEKARVNEKENLLDIHISELSTELEVIQTEMQSVQSFIDDAISNMSWGA